MELDEAATMVRLLTSQLVAGSPVATAVTEIATPWPMVRIEALDVTLVCWVERYVFVECSFEVPEGSAIRDIAGVEHREANAVRVGNVVGASLPSERWLSDTGWHGALVEVWRRVIAARLEGRDPVGDALAQIVEEWNRRPRY